MDALRFSLIALLAMTLFVPVADARDFACIDACLVGMLATPPVVAKRDAAAFATGFSVIFVLACRALTHTYFVGPHVIGQVLAHAVHHR